MENRSISKATRINLLLAGDLTILLFSLWLTLLIRYGQKFDYSLWQSHLAPFVVVIIFLLIVFYIEDLYELGTSKGRVHLLNRILQSLLIGCAFAFAFFYIGIDRLFTIKPQRVFLIYVIIAGILIYFWRLWFYKVARSPRIADGIIFIGYNKKVGEIIRQIQKRPELGFQVRAIIPVANGETEIIPAEYEGLVTSVGLDQLKATCQQKEIQTIITTIHPREDKSLMKNLFECLALKIKFYELTKFYENITGKIPVTTIEQIWFLENLTERDKRTYGLFKRIIDIIVSIIALTISLPFIPLIAFAIKTTSKGPAFFKQIRTGKDGKNFLAIKFRTMVANAETNGPQWASKNDPRVTAVGRFFRKTRIDEIPQLINILRGEMSLIGPRPERPEFIEQLQNQIPFYRERLMVKPGLTGWAQVMGPAYGGSLEETLEKIQFDLYYIKNRSIALDLSILLKTVRTVLTRKGQ